MVDGDAREPALAHALFQVGEGAVLRAVDAERDDGGLGFVGNQAGAFVDLHQAAGGGDAAFGEDHAVAAFGNFVHEPLEGDGFGGVEFVAIDQMQEDFGPPLLGDEGVDGEDGWPGRKAPRRRPSSKET